MSATIHQLDDYRKTPRRVHEDVSIDADAAHRQREQIKAMFAAWDRRLTDERRS